MEDSKELDLKLLESTERIETQTEAAEDLQQTLKISKKRVEPSVVTTILECTCPFLLTSFLEFGWWNSKSLRFGL